MTRTGVRPTLRVVEGGRGGGAPAMWDRLHELHAGEEAGTLSETEHREMLGIEAAVREPAQSPLREVIYMHLDRLLD
jgi:hypothetical protein